MGGPGSRALSLIGSGAPGPERLLRPGRLRRLPPIPAQFLLAPREAAVYRPLGRVGPEYLLGWARLVAPVLAVRPPGGATLGPSGTTAVDA